MQRKAFVDASFMALEEFEAIQLSVESMPVYRHVAKNDWCESAVLNSVKILKSVI